MGQLLLLQTWVKLLQIGGTISTRGLFVTNQCNYYVSRIITNSAQRVPCFKHKCQKYFVELNFLSPVSLIVLDNFVRLKFTYFGFTFM